MSGSTAPRSIQVLKSKAASFRSASFMPYSGQSTRAGARALRARRLSPRPAPESNRFPAHGIQRPASAATALSNLGCTVKVTSRPSVGPSMPSDGRPDRNMASSSAIAGPRSRRARFPSSAIFSHASRWAASCSSRLAVALVAVAVGGIGLPPG